MTSEGSHAGDPGPDRVLLSPSEYLRDVLATGGSILQSNSIGALTLVTSYRSLGRFECVRWNIAGPDPALWAQGELILALETLESANGFHYALAKRLWAGPWGKRTRERSKWYQEDVADLVRLWARR